MSTSIVSEYEQQAQAFLNTYKLSLSVKWAANQTDPLWSGNSKHGDKYRITLRRRAGSTDYGPQSISFNFWGSLNDAYAGKEPTAYDVLDCISSDCSYADMTVSDLCDELGYNSDSIREVQQVKAVIKFAERLRDFFTRNEQTALQEIQ